MEGNTWLGPVMRTISYVVIHPFTVAPRSEKLLGQFIAEYPGSEAVRVNLHVATKV